MDFCEARKTYQGNFSKYKGAIFMCNRTTKKESLERKLFGLPRGQTGLLYKMKAGMLLFLFEYEERKLYGVFQATSDGCLNIIPNAFLSSGTSYPCQILFKRVWMCKPLTEDEFRDAIIENYYEPYKFNFGLTYEQIFRLLNLFYLKKIRLQQTQGRGIPNRILREFNRSRMVWVAGKGRSMEFESNEHKMDDGRDPISRRHVKSLVVASGHRCPVHQRLSYTLSRKTNYAHKKQKCYQYEASQGSGDELPTVMLSMEHPLPEEPSASSMSSMALQVPRLATQPSESQSGEHISTGQQLMDCDYIPLSISEDEEDGLVKNVEAPESPEVDDCESVKPYLLIRHIDEYYPTNAHIDEVSANAHIDEYSPTNAHIDKYSPTNACVDEYYLTTANSKLHSDVEGKRTSVFSRLSGTKMANQHYKGRMVGEAEWESWDGYAVSHENEGVSRKYNRRTW